MSEDATTTYNFCCCAEATRRFKKPLTEVNHKFFGSEPITNVKATLLVASKTSGREVVSAFNSLQFTS